MKVQILRDCDHRVQPAVIQSFKADTTVDLPKATADALIARGDATQAPKEKTHG